MNIQRFCVIFVVMVLTTASVWADVVDSTGVHFGKLYTNNGVFNPGGAGTVGVTGYNLYVENLALGKATAQNSDYSSDYTSGKAVDGISYDTDTNNFTHTKQDAGTKWWQVNFADTPTAISSVQLANRPGYTGRLVNFTVSIYNGNPSDGGTLLWTSDAQPTFSSTADITLDSIVQGTWLRITNGPTDTTPLTLVEVAIPTGGTADKAGTYGSQTGWTAPNFKQEGGATLQIDTADGGFDTLDVSGTFIAAGTFDLNVVNTTGLAAGEYQVVKAGAYKGSFGTVKVTGVSTLENANLVLKTDNLNSQGKINLEAISGSLWKSGAASTNFTDVANWSNGLNGTLYFGYYSTATGAAATATLSSALDHTGGIRIAESAGSAGTLTIANGAALTEASDIWVGIKGAGTLNQTGGTVTANATVYTADQAGSTGSMTLSGGTFTAKNFILGTRGNATLNVATGGSFTVTNAYNGTDQHGFEIGYDNGSVGTLNITGGMVNVSVIQMGHAVGSTGNLNISDGSLTINAGENNFRIGDSGKGNFTQTGGTVNFNAPMYAADSGGSSATLNLSGGTLTAISTFVLGTRGSAVMNVSGSANVLIKSEVNIGFGAGNGSKGTINQSGGTVTVTNANGVKIGNSGWYENVTGAYNLSGGTLVTPQLVVARPDATNVNASFVLSGTGKAVISGTLAVPTTMSGGSLQAGTISGTVTQYAGTLTPGGDGTYGTTTISGTYNLIANTLVAPESGNFALGKVTSQVSTYSDDATQFGSANAVDGNRNAYANGSYKFSHTKGGANQWWQVDLGGTVSLDSIMIYNRNGNGGRLTPFHFELYEGTNDALGNKLWSSSSLSSLTGTAYTFGEETLGESLYGRTLRIVRDFPNGTLSDDNSTLNLLEVEVYGEVAKPTIHLDFKADGTDGDKLILKDGATLDLTGGVLEIAFDDVDALAPGLELDFLDVQEGAKLTGNWAEIILPDLPNPEMFWDLSALQSGTLSIGVPEPATWVLMLLVFAGAACCPFKLVSKERHGA